GLPNSELGRIGLAQSQVDPDVVYAIVEARSNGGFYRSTDNGVSWQRRSDHNTIGLYYQEIFTDPIDVDRIYSMDTRTWISNDGGASFEILGERNKHVDNHALWIDPDDTDHLIIGSDGGLYESWDRGETYRWFENLPLAQFYRVEVDSVAPFYRIFGGTQDNSSVGGPSQTRTRRGGRNADWFLTQGGDGFYSRIDPENPNIVYAESQNGGLSRFNLETGERISIRPEGALDEAIVWHWDAPLIISPHNAARIYFAANRLFVSDDRGGSWRYASPDLTKGIDRNQLPMMGRVWGVDAVSKNRSTSVWGAIVSLAESPLQEGLLFAGTDDGMIQISEDGGDNWRPIPSIGLGVPDTTFVTDIQPSWHDPNTVYVAFDNHKAGDYRPYIAKSTDLGATWEVIQNDLPERGTVYTILEDYKQPDLLFAGTEFGAYFSNDGGGSWSELGAGLPTIQVRDMVFQTQHDDLVIATFGRGFYVFDGLEQLRAMTPDFMASEGGLVPVTDIPMFVPSNPDPNWQGETFYTAANPEAGATFRYYRRDAIRTLREERERAERAAAARGEDVFYPSWDSLRVEDTEVPAQMILTVRDPEGTLVTHLTGRTSSGVTTVRWNLRYPSATPITQNGGGGGFFGGGFGGGGGAHNGPYIIPGTYTVSLATYDDGVLTELGSRETFEVYMLDQVQRSPEVLAFQKEVQRLQRAVLGANAAAAEAQTRVSDLETAFERVPLDNSDEIQNTVESLRERLRGVQWDLNGDPTVRRRAEASPTSLAQRLGRITGGAWSGTLTEVPGMHREQYGLIGERFVAILEDLRNAIQIDLKALEDLADEVGAPWTSGRLPVWGGGRPIS
ncbi:MAG: glycosyl hydrolase, partial [Gemmatimonadetes bacterium]|nr:glycosyl hydrolase [Gemmatimonadota bacterium]